MNSFRFYGTFASVLILATLPVALVAVQRQNWTLLVFAGYGVLFLTLAMFLIAIRYMSRKIRTESRNSRGELRLVAEQTQVRLTTLEKSTHEAISELSVSADEILEALVAARPMLSGSRKQVKAATEVVVKGLLALEKSIQDHSTSVAMKHNRLIETGASDLTAALSAQGEKIETDTEAVKSLIRATKEDLSRAVQVSERKVIAARQWEKETRRTRERLEAAERRILGTVETEAFQHHVTLHNHSERIERLSHDVSSLAEEASIMKETGLGGLNSSAASTGSSVGQDIVRKLRRHITTTVRDGTRQVEALLQLAPHFAGKKMPMPSTGDFAIDAKALSHLVTLIEEHQPKKILELGSGTSTVWLGYLCKSYGGHVITLDHLVDYLELTQTSVERHQLTNEVEVRLAPLEMTEIDGEEFRWYSTSAVEDLYDIDLVLIDGPPAGTGKMARYPALPEIFGRLAPNVTIVLDDAHRDEESSIIDRWLERFPEFKLIEQGTSRLAVIRRDS